MLTHADTQTHADTLQIGRLLANICTGCPDGVVAFLPSFAYLEQLMHRWAATGALAALAARCAPRSKQGACPNSS